MDALESLDVWKKACQLAVTIYGVMEKCRDLGLKDQITRSALSIPSNIAEGYERDYLPEMVRFFRIAKGSLASSEPSCISVSRLDSSIRKKVRPALKHPGKYQKCCKAW